MAMVPRREKILALIQTQRGCSVTQLAAAYGVTARTIRSDLTWLAQRGLIQRSHGLALPAQRVMRAASGADASQLGQFYRHVRRSEQTPALKGRLSILGTFFIDISCSVATLPLQPGSLLPASDIRFGPGGKGANLALAAAVAGAQVHFAAKVGTDSFSQQAWEHLMAAGIHSFMLYQTDQASTGCSNIWVSQQSGETLMAINPGANHTLTAQEVEALQGEIAAATLFVTHSGINVSAVRLAIATARELGVPVVFYAAPLNPLLIDCLAHIHLLFIGQHEAETLTGLLLTTPRLAERAALQLQHQGAASVALMMDDGSVLACEEKTLNWFAPWPTVPVDGSGANDAFCGACCARLAQGESLAEAIDYAGAVAALAREKAGAASMPNQQEIAYRLTLRQRALSPAPN